MIVNDYLKDFWHNRRDRKWAIIIQIWAFSLFEQWNHLWESSFLTRSKSSWRFFSVVPIFAIRFHVYFLHQKHQSWVGFIRFCFSTFASHHWLVGDRRQFFPSLVVVFPPLVIVVFFSLIDLLSSAMIFGFWAKSIFDSIFEWPESSFLKMSDSPPFGPNETILASSPLLLKPIGPSLAKLTFGNLLSIISLAL